MAITVSRMTKDELREMIETTVERKLAGRRAVCPASRKASPRSQTATVVLACNTPQLAAGFFISCMYSVRMLDAATRELARLDKPIRRRIVERINWLAENFDEIDPKTLTAELAGFFKLRVGDYRFLCQMLHDEQLIVIHLMATEEKFIARARDGRSLLYTGADRQ